MSNSVEDVENCLSENSCELFLVRNIYKNKLDKFKIANQKR
jgi:hypothetical protein